MSNTSFRKSGKLLLLMSDFLPIFLIGCLYEFNYHFFLGFYLFLSLTAISIFGNILWVIFLKASLNYNPVNKSGRNDFKRINERNSLFSSYVLTQMSIIPAILFRGYLGIETFIIILFFLSLAYLNTNIVLFNPLLSLVGYKFYIIEYENEDIYVISKNRLTTNDLKNSDDLSFYEVIDDFYLIKSRSSPDCLLS